MARLNGLIRSIFLFFLTVWTSQAQTYYPVLSMDREWQVNETNHHPPLSEEQFIFRLVDTVSYNSIQYLTFTPNTFLYDVVVREDTILKRLYAYDVVNDKEYVIFDFSLNIGDTLPSNFSVLDLLGNFEADSIAIITGMDTVYLFDVSPRRRFHITPTTNPAYFEYYFLEGLGGPMGFISSRPVVYLGLSYRLQCLVDNNVAIYGHCIPLDIDEEENNNLKVYPNPFTHHLQIKSSLPTFMYVYNILGEEIYRSSSLLMSHSLSTESYPSGIYMIKGVDVDGDITFLEKVIKE